MFYLIEMQPSASLNLREVQAVLSEHGDDWYRFAPSSWVVDTIDGATAWTDRLRPFVQVNGGHLFVSRLDLEDRQGWMPHKFWDWLNGRIRVSRTR